MKRKKWFLKTSALILTASMLLSTLSGCGSSSTPTGQTNPSSGSTEAKPGGAPTVLKVEVFDRAGQGSSNPTNNYWTKWISDQMLEKYNITVEYVSVPRTEEVQQLNVLMASGSAPDIVFTYTASVAYNYYKQGGVADLTQYIDQSAPNLKSYLGNDILSYGKFDDKQYLIPAKRVSRAANATLYAQRLAR